MTNLRKGGVAFVVNKSPHFKPASAQRVRAKASSKRTISPLQRQSSIFSSPSVKQKRQKSPSRPKLPPEVENSINRRFCEVCETQFQMLRDTLFMRKAQIIQHLRRYGLHVFAEATQQFLARAYSRIHSQQYIFIFIDYLNPLNPMKCLETCYSIYKEATHTRITPEDLFNLITGRTQELLRSDLQLMINAFLGRFQQLRADSSVLGRGLSKHSSYHEPQSGSPVWLRHSKNRSMLDFQSYKSLVHPRGKEDGLTLSQFQRIEFPCGELPDLYYVLIYVLYGEAALEYARTTLRVPFYKIHLDTCQEGPIQHSKVIPERIELRIQKQEIKVVKMKKNAERIKQATKLIKKTYPFYSMGSEITKEIYNCMVKLVVQLMDYSYFPLGVVISKASFLENSDVVFGGYAPTLANSMFYEIGNLAENPSVEQLTFPRMVDYFYLHFFKRNMFPETKNMEAFRYFDFNKDGRLSSSDFETFEESGEYKLSPEVGSLILRLKDKYLTILWAPKGFRDPHIDLLTFNRVTEKDSALLELIETQLERLGQEAQAAQKKEEEEENEESNSEGSFMFEAIKIEFQEAQL